MNLIDVVRVAEKIYGSTSLVWKLLREDASFPKPVRLSKRVTRWIESDIDAWVLTKKQGEVHEAQ